MDKLDAIFDMQQRLNRDIRARRGLEEDASQEVWLQRMTLAMISELAELLDEINFKWWKNPKPVNQDAVQEELTDILHFLVSMCLEAGLDARMLFERYMRKNEENFKRQDGTSEKKGYSVSEG